jgi:integrase/recombinase XerD
MNQKDNNWIYPQYDKQFEQQLRRLEQEPISEANKELIKRFQDHLFTTGAKQARVAKLTWGMRKIALLLQKDLQSATKADIERVVAAIQRDPKYTDSTKSDYKRCLKHFYRWFEDEDERLRNPEELVRTEAHRLYHYLRKSVKTSCPLKELDPGSILRDEDIHTVIQKGCRQDYERAFVSLIHESGCRIGELLRIRIKDIQQKDTHWIIRVNGKTGERTIPIRESIPYLAQWMNNHPELNNPDAMLWISMHNRWQGQPLRYIGARQLLHRCFKRAGFIVEEKDEDGKIVERELKKLNPHHFRHSRATIDAPNFSEPILCKMRGWVLGSHQVRRYTHLSGKDTEEAFLKSKGLMPTENKTEEKKLQPCVCGMLNAAEAKFCTRCGKALSIETAMKEQAYMQKAFEVMEKIMKDPELQKQFEAYKTHEAS